MGESSLSVTSELSKLGFHSVNPIHVLNHLTSGLSTALTYVFDWLYFLAEIAILLGALFFIVGAIFHHPRIQQAGGRTVLYALLGFAAAVIVPGLIMSLNFAFHS